MYVVSCNLIITRVFFRVCISTSYIIFLIVSFLFHVFFSPGFRVFDLLLSLFIFGLVFSLDFDFRLTALSNITAVTKNTAL